MLSNENLYTIAPIALAHRLAQKRLVKVTSMNEYRTHTTTVHNINSANERTATWQTK